MTGIDPHQVDAVKRSAQAPVSLETPVGEDDGTKLADLIPDTAGTSPYELAADTLTADALRHALACLSYRERRVLELRYGLDGQPPRTLEHIARTFNITRERARQIEGRTLAKLRALPEARALREGP